VSTRRRLLAGATLAVALLGASGCTSSSHHGSTPTTSGSRSTPASTVAKPLPSVVVQAGDLPSSWHATPRSTTAQEAQQHAALIKCVGGTDTSARRTGAVWSPRFLSGTMTLQSQAASFRTAADVKADLAFLRRPKIERCYRTLIRQQVAQVVPGATIADLTVTVRTGAHGGPRTVAGSATAVVHVSTGGQQVVAYLEQTFIAAGPTEIEVDFESLGMPTPSALRAKVIAALARRAG
jgi:hypothetical protein